MASRGSRLSTPIPLRVKGFKSTTGTLGQHIQLRHTHIPKRFLCEAQICTTTTTIFSTISVLPFLQLPATCGCFCTVGPLGGYLSVYICSINSLATSCPACRSPPYLSTTLQELTRLRAQVGQGGACPRKARSCDPVHNTYEYSIVTRSPRERGQTSWTVGTGDLILTSECLELAGGGQRRGGSTA